MGPGMLARQPGGQFPVLFQGQVGARPGGQDMGRKGSPPRADLDDRVIRADPQAAHDLGGDVGIDQKILAQAAFGRGEPFAPLRRVMAHGARHAGSFRTSSKSCLSAHSTCQTAAASSSPGTAAASRLAKVRPGQPPRARKTSTRRASGSTSRDSSA